MLKAKTSFTLATISLATSLNPRNGRDGRRSWLFQSSPRSSRCGRKSKVRLLNKSLFKLLLILCFFFLKCDDLFGVLRPLWRTETAGRLFSRTLQVSLMNKRKTLIVNICFTYYQTNVFILHLSACLIKIIQLFLINKSLGTNIY